MDPRELFWTEEFQRYSTECRRLARLARKPPAVPPSWLARVQEFYAEWLSDIHRNYTRRALQPPQFARAARRRR